MPSKREREPIGQIVHPFDHIFDLAAAENAPKPGEICRQARAELDKLYQNAKIVKRDMPETNMSLLARLSASQQVHICCLAAFWGWINLHALVVAGLTQG